MRLILLAFPLLAGCAVSVGPAAPAAPAGFEAITAPGQFLDKVAGKPIVFDNGGVLIANPDGTLGGNFNGVAPTGAWEFTGGQLCRTVTIGAEQFPKVCNLLEATGDQLRFLNPDGTLSSVAKLGGA